MIIDTHVHLGYDETYDRDFRPEYVARTLEDNMVDRLILQPATAVFLEGARQQHDDVAAFAARYPGRIVGMADPNPHLPEDVYRAEVLRCVRELGFVGIKINTVAHGVAMNGRAAQKVYRIARELDIPVMMHTAAMPAFASPLAAIPVAKEHPQVRLVLAHSGAGAGGESILAAQTCPNIFLETSWSNVEFLESAVRTLGAGRLMYGSDHMENIPVELAKHRSIGLTAAEVDMCLGGTALEVYRLGDRWG